MNTSSCFCFAAVVPQLQSHTNILVSYIKMELKVWPLETLFKFPKSKLNLILYQITLPISTSQIKKIKTDFKTIQNLTRL